MRSLVFSVPLILILLLAPFAFSATFDFVEAPLSDVARALSLAYEVPILVDQGIESQVTFHLENVGVMEGLTALCESQGLKVVESSGVFHIRRAVDSGEHYFSTRDSLVSVDVRNKDVLEFIREYGANTGVNVLPSQRVSGRISGNLRDVPAEKALRSLLESQGFRVWKENGFLRVDILGQESNGYGENVQISRNENLYSASLRSAPLASVLREISRLAELNLVLYGDIQESVQLNFSDVPLDDLLKALFRGSRYAYSKDSVNLFVSERGARHALSVMKLRSLKYVHSEKAMEHLSKFMQGGNFVVVEIKEQNALLLGGAAPEIEMAENLLTQVDVPPMQVTLSCILLEIKKGKSFEIGLHGGASRKTAERNIGVRGFYDFLGSDLSRSGAFGKIGILPDRFEMELASLEENNMAEVLARPRLTTLNGNKAELNVTNTVYYLVSQVSADGYPITDYRSFNDGISLELTPSVTKEGSITLEVSPEIKTAGRSTGDGPRDISTRNLKTTVVLKNGETLCLGGLRRKNKSEVRSAVPFLGSIPLIGRLFSYVSEEEDESELAVFITPEVEIHESARK